mmetsp:Transcript_2391/g.7079  ORF Transcript_2391/g.7079 Transcript_2391/m.7079 type:complete len:260 (+) Transcript_2391:342-1121(+)
MRQHRGAGRAGAGLQAGARGRLCGAAPRHQPRRRARARLWAAVRRVGGGGGLAAAALGARHHPRPQLLPASECARGCRGCTLLPAASPLGLDCRRAEDGVRRAAGRRLRRLRSLQRRGRADPLPPRHLPLVRARHRLRRLARANHRRGRARACAAREAAVRPEPELPLRAQGVGAAVPRRRRLASRRRARAGTCRRAVALRPSRATGGGRRRPSPRLRHSAPLAERRTRRPKYAPALATHKQLLTQPRAPAPQDAAYTR